MIDSVKAYFWLFTPQDEDFVAEKDDAGSPTDDSEEEGSDASDDGLENSEAITACFWMQRYFSRNFLSLLQF